MHPIVGCATSLADALDAVSDAPAWSMTADEQRAVLVALSTARASLDELFLRVLAAADRNDVGTVDASPSTAAWLATATGRTPASTSADVRLATALDDALDGVRGALAGGRLGIEQARVVVAAVQALPARATSEDRARAEQVLVDLAAGSDGRPGLAAPALRTAGRRIFEVVDPEAADEEARPEARRRGTVGPREDLAPPFQQRRRDHPRVVLDPRPARRDVAQAA